jgi:putative endonuclease
MGTHGLPTGPAPQEARRRAAATGEDPRRSLGRRGEDLAADHLRRLGFTVLARNVRTRAGEIDLIAFGEGAIVFTEVKTLRAGAPGAPAGADRQPLLWLRHRQRARIRRLAAAWLSDREGARPAARTIRFDAIGVTVDAGGRLVRLEHVEGAW